MHIPFRSVVVGLMGFWAAALPANRVLAAEGSVRPQWVAEVREGRRHEARASWWGFDAHDSTAFLQEAINSKVKRLIIDRCLLRNTAGTAPQAGIDFEPNDPADVLLNCEVKNCIASGNAGTGYQVCSQSLAGRSKPISIVIDDCVSRGNAQHAIHLCSAPKDPPAGRLRITRFLAEGDAMSGTTTGAVDLGAFPLRICEDLDGPANEQSSSFCSGLGGDKGCRFRRRRQNIRPACCPSGRLNARR